MERLEQPKTIYVICGPTAVGKTAFAIKLALALGTKIISADSRQCYNELNIGVAKPSVEELAAVHHYFINSHSITEEVNAAAFEAYALNAVSEIFGKTDCAVMVGGTGLYIKAFCEGIDDIPEVDPAIRQTIIHRYNDDGLQYLQEELKQKDPAFWAVAEQQNPQRLMRALEVILSTGKSITTFRKGKKEHRPFEIRKVGLELPREVLYNRINNRADSMIQAGLLDEVKELQAYKHLNALQTVGYKELFEYLDNQVTLEKAVENIKTNTRHYAKRQMTWFKKDAEMKWFSADSINVADLIDLQ